MAAEGETLETRVALLLTMTERLAKSMDSLTEELRHTNQVIQQQHVEFKLAEQRLESLEQRVEESKFADRLRTVELQIKGLFAMCGLIVLSLAGKVLPLVWEAVMGGGK